MLKAEDHREVGGSGAQSPGKAGAGEELECDRYVWNNKDNGTALAKVLPATKKNLETVAENFLVPLLLL